MSDHARGQVERSAAQVYEEFFVPALFGAWAPKVADAAGLGAGQRVLDVACGTGVLAREAARRVGATGSVTGLDPNEGMLDVARGKGPSIDWRTGTAEALPFADARFDRVVCQFGMMFFQDRAGAVDEMMRVLRPGGTLAVAVFAPIGRAPGYAAMERLLREVLDADAAEALRVPFEMGDEGELRDLFQGARADDVALRTLTAPVKFPSIDAWVHTEIKGWTLAGRLSDAEFVRLQAAARVALAPFAGADGAVEFPIAAHLLSARA